MADLTDVYAALQKADAAGDAAGAKQLADYIRTQGASTDAAAPTDAGTDYGREAAIGLRAAGQGALSTLTLPNTIATAAQNTPAFLFNHILGTKYPYKQSAYQQISDLVTKAGAPVPSTSGEKLASAGISGVTAGLGGVGVTGLPGVANAVRGASAGASGALAQEGARQVGLPPWAQIGAGLLFSQTPAFAESAVRTGADLVAPLTASGQQRAVGTLLNTQAQDPAKALANLDSSAPIVPNSLPTAGVASQDFGLLGIEKALQSKNSPAFSERFSAQNSARQAELSDMAGSPADLQAAIAARGRSTAPIYDYAAKQSAPIDNEMIALMQRPSMQAAIAKAQQLAGERGQAFGITTPGAGMSLSGRDLQGIKMALDDMKTTAFTQGIGSHQASAMQDTLDSLKDWMQRNVPAQRSADTAFQNLSAPVNRMTSLQELQQRANLNSTDISRGGEPILGNAAFSRGLADVQSNPRSGVGAMDMSRLSAIQKDLQNSQAMNSPLLKAPGSDTFQNLSLNQNLGPFARTGTKLLEAPYRFFGSDAAINDILTRSFLDPKFAASLMRKSSVPRPDINFHPYDAGAFGGLVGSGQQ